MVKRISEFQTYKAAAATFSEVKVKYAEWQKKHKVAIPDSVKRNLHRLKSGSVEHSIRKRRIKRLPKEEVKFWIGRLNPANRKSRAVPRLNTQIQKQVSAVIRSIKEEDSERFIGSMFKVRQLMHKRAFYTGEGHAQEDFLKNIDPEIKAHLKEHAEDIRKGLVDMSSYINRLRISVDKAYEHFSDQDVLATNHLLTLSSARSFLVRMAVLAQGEDSASEWLHLEPDSDNDIQLALTKTVSALPVGRLH